MQKKIKEIIIKLNEMLIAKKSEIKLVAIGGRTLNYFLETERVSDDTDFVFVTDEEINKARKLFKVNVLKNLEAIINNKIRNADRNYEADNLWAKRDEYEEDKISHYYEASPWIFKVILFIDNNKYLLDFSFDETMNFPEFSEYCMSAEMDAIKPEFTLAAKQIIAYKRLGDFDNFVTKKYFRHLFDIYRIYIDENYKIDEKIFEMAFEKIKKYELENPIELHRLEIKDKDKLNKILFESSYTYNGIYYKRIIDLILVLISDEYGFKIRKKDFEEKMKTYSSLIDKKFFDVDL